MANPANVDTARAPSYATPGSRPRRIRIKQLSRVDAPSRRAPNALHMNLFPFPFLGTWDPARHGHHPVFPVGAQRRVGAWRFGMTLGSNHKAGGKR